MLTRKRRISPILLVATCVALLSVVGLTWKLGAAHAAGACGAQVNPHNGFFKDPARGMVRGVSAKLEVQTSDPCVMYANSFTTLYDMIYGVNANDGWSQVGYYKTEGGSTYDWGQYHANNADGYHDTFGSHVTAGTDYSYTVQYVVNGCYSTQIGVYSCLQNIVNGDDFFDTPFDPGTAWGAGNWFLQYSEESLYYQSNVPGSTSTQAHVGSMTYEDNSYTWHGTTCTLINYNNDDAAHWAHTYTGNCPNQTLYTSHPY